MKNDFAPGIQVREPLPDFFDSMIVDVTRIDEQDVNLGFNGSLMTPVAKLSAEIDVIISQEKPLWRFPANRRAIFNINAHQTCLAGSCDSFESKPALAATHSEFHNQTRMHTQALRKYCREMVSNVAGEMLSTARNFL
jgi:hypothetical protein